MATINELPNELLISVFEHLADHVPWPIGDLVSLSFTSRRFRVVAEPFLYHTYEGHDYQHLFARTLIEQPTSTNHVRKIDLALHRDIDDRPWRNSITTTRTIATTRLQKAVEQLGLPSPITADWKYALQCADRQAYAANILFSTARTVEDLCLRYDHRRFEGDPSSPARWYQYNWLFVALRLATMQQSLASNSFQNLRTLKMVREGGTAQAPLSPLSFVFRLPYLRHFEAHGHFEHKLGASARSWDTGALLQDGDWYGIDPSSIETMVFRDADLGSSTISLLLRSCKALKHFDLEVVPKGTISVIVDYLRIDRALYCHASSLESIRIDISEQRALEAWGSDQHVRFSLRSLPQFPVIKTLELPFNAILSIGNPLNLNVLDMEPICQSTLGSYLPLSIEDISISAQIQGYNALFPKLYDFAMKDLRLFTKMRRLHVFDTEPRELSWSLLKDKFVAEANVELTIGC